MIIIIHSSKYTEPHIGHLYTVILGDAVHRWNVIKGAKEAIYSCGTDEHGAKVTT